MITRNDGINNIFFGSVSNLTKPNGGWKAFFFSVVSIIAFILVTEDRKAQRYGNNTGRNVTHLSQQNKILKQKKKYNIIFALYFLYK